MKLISKAKSDNIADYLCEIAISDSLQSDLHRYHMGMVASAKTDEEALKLMEDILEKLETQQEMKLVSEVNDKKQAEELVVIATSLTNKEKIDIIYNNAKNYADGDPKKEIPAEVFTYKN